jgi:hypothetical protein
MIKCGSLQLDENSRIEAKGTESSSGGSINIEVTSGGDVTGSGVIDVGVVASTYSGGGGGRAAVVGYGSITDAIVENVAMDGAFYYKSGAGSFYHRGVNQTSGNGGVRSSFRVEFGTMVDGVENALKSIFVDNGFVAVDPVFAENESLTVNYLYIADGSRLSVSTMIIYTGARLYFDGVLSTYGGIVAHGEVNSLSKLECQEQLFRE